jgi:ABC-type multidrug transport system permease subunit
VFDPQAQWASSPEYAQVVATLNSGIDSSVHLPPAPTSEYATSLLAQTVLCIRRAFLNKFRQPQQIRAFVFMYIIMGLIIGSLYWQLDDSQLGARNRVALIYFSTIFAALGAFAAVPGVVISRATYYREKPSFLRPFAFFVAQSLSEVPFTCLATTAYSFVVYFMAGLSLADHGVRFVLFAAVYSFASVLAVAFAQMVAVLSPSQESASTTVGVSLSVLSLFAGFIIPKNSIEWYWVWLHYLSIFKVCAPRLMNERERERVCVCVCVSDATLL